VTATGPTVGVVGLGAMGARLAANLLTDGYPVVVANRSPGPVQRLVAAGAVAAATPAETATSVDVLLAAVADDNAAHAVWLDPGTGILAGAPPDLLAVETSTLSPGCVRALAAHAAQHGLRLLEAPMLGSRPQVEARALIHLTAGPADVLDAARPVLNVSAARLHHVGPDFGAAATLKLIVNALLATQIATLAELLGLAASAGLDIPDTAQLLTGLPVTSPAAARAIGLIAAGEYAPNFPIRLVAKDLRYLTALADDLGSDAPMSHAARTGYQRSEGAGHGDDDLTAIATNY
jgi:3-hydroxyisobutyrate dehydrogenase